MKRKLAALAICSLTALLLAVAPSAAHAAPMGSVSTADIGDLDRECQNHLTEAAQLNGWTRNRYEQCHRVKNQHINLTTTEGQYLGFIEWDLEFDVYAEPATRRLDMLVAVTNVEMSERLSGTLGNITVTLACSSTAATCHKTEHTDTVQGWYDNPAWRSAWADSPDDTGLAPYSIANLDIDVYVKTEYRDGRTIPYEAKYAVTKGRFDSARSKLGNGPWHGTVLPDYIPTLQLDARATSDHKSEARHVYDAQHYPIRTFPNLPAKSPPGAVPAPGVTPRPLHRLMDPRNDDNHTEAVKVCIDVWGPDYTDGGLQCDEYPFKATYEGAAESTRSTQYPKGNWRQWHGSARPIDGDENGNGGRELSNFYGANRILDGDAFYVGVITDGPLP